MFEVVVFLLAATAVLNLIIFAIRWFWAFLGRGKPLKAAMEAGMVEAETEKAIHEREMWNLGRKLDKQARKARRKSGKSGDGSQDDATTTEKRKLQKPTITWQHRKEIIKADYRYREQYLDNMKLRAYQVIIVFVIGSVIGLIIEQIYTYAMYGATEGRYGLVWGPFSPLYGAGAVIFTFICWPLRKKHAKWWMVFLISAVAGGLLEQITGWGMLTFFNAESWNYLHFPDHITQWVAWRFLFFWGLIGLVWYEVMMPMFIYAIGQPTTTRQRTFIVLLSIYLAADICVTLACFIRSNDRAAGIEATNAIEMWLDEYYSDEFIEERFENLSFVQSSE